eukprot:TRINITY_DN6734_c0_g1_i1.p1 TRINITY_DN6734_c0_g1~~TRINITY_DN6734_c0_g1_i1.p1  ORF type:complete len:137 (+),score=7.68 TRINITY_DN6734_c0_g1_i1:246-656(+)
MRDRDLLGSILFCLSLNYKQMNLYYAPAFFWFLLGKHFDSTKINSSIKRVFILGMVVIGTFVFCWLPFLGSLETSLQVLARIFPVGRGLYEDKVANLWCSIEPFVKLKRIFTIEQLIKLCRLDTIGNQFLLETNKL